MVYIYAQAITPELRNLASNIDAKLISRYDGFNFLKGKSTLSFIEGDRLICWGHHIPVMEPIATLNTNPIGVNNAIINETYLFKAQVAVMGVTKVAPLRYIKALTSEIPLASGYNLPTKHIPNYMTAYTPHVARYRVHIVNGAVIAICKAKQNSSNFQLVDTDSVSTAFSEIAKHVLHECRLDFGAITLFKKNRSEVPILHKIQSAPPLDAKLIDAYSEAFKFWIDSNAPVRNIAIDAVEEL